MGDGDPIEAPDGQPPRTLGDLSRVVFEGGITILHVLPFFPYSSDRVSAEIDYSRSIATWVRGGISMTQVSLSA